MGELESPAGASQFQPGHVVILLDVSESMALVQAGRRRIEVVSEALAEIPRLAAVPGGGEKPGVRSRFKVAIVVYSNRPFTALDFAWAHRVSRAPVVKPGGKPNAFEAFRVARGLLTRAVASAGSGPAPVLLHISGGRYAYGGSPAGLVRRIQDLQTAEGRIVVLQAFMGETAHHALRNLPRWPGINRPEDVDQLYENRQDAAYARELFEMSSSTPAGYLPFIRQTAGLRCFQYDARLFFPAPTPDLLATALRIGFASGWNAESPVSPAGMRLVCLKGLGAGQAIDLPASGLVTFGRSLGHSVVIADSAVSRDHAVLEVREGRYIVEDWPGRPSTTGVVIARAGLRSRVMRHELAPGDHLVLGEAEFLFDLSAKVE